MPHHLSSARSASLPGGGGIRAFARKGGGADAGPRIDAEGRFEGYASLFGVADLGRDIVMPGAFRASIARRQASGVKLLWQHEPRHPIGDWEVIEEDRLGLFVRGRLDLASSKARDLHHLIARGAVDGLSIGYRAETERREPATGLRRLDRLDLWEISIVTFPLLPQARIAPRGEGRGMKGGRDFAAAATLRRPAQF